MGSAGVVHISGTVHALSEGEQPTSGYDVPSALYDPNMRIAVHAWRDFYATGNLFTVYRNTTTYFHTLLLF
jgi:hypothetical protein